MIPMVDHPPLSPSVETMRQPVLEGTTRPLPWRMEQLERLQGLLAGAESALLEALAEDLGKPPLEAYVELAGVLRIWLADGVVETPFWDKIEVDPATGKITTMYALFSIAAAPEEYWRDLEPEDFS